MFFEGWNETMLMTAIECQRKYGSRYLMAKAVKAGMLHKVATGVYSDGSRFRDVELLQTRYPASAVTMLSAYYYRNLTDVIPDKCHLATERDSTKIGDRSVVQYFVPKGTGGIGVESTVLRGAQVRIFDMERLLIETVRLRTKLPADLYHEVIGNYRRRAGELYPARIEDYLDAFPKREFLFDIIRKEVL